MHNTSRTQQFARVSRILITLAIAVSLTMLVRAMRQDEGSGRGRGPGGGLSGFSLFAALETDGQEGLSPAEIEHAPAVLRSLDKNGDSRITPDELPVGRGGRGGRGGPGGFPGGGEGGRGDRGEGPSEAPQVSADDLVAMLMAFDANKDGKLTKSETPERLQSLFDRADSNKDGVLTAAEIKASAQAQEQQGQQAMRGRGEGRGDGEGRFGRGGPGGPDPLISALDVNKDGALSFQEIDAIATVLHRFDRNGDGIVTLEEIFAGGRGRG